MRFAGRKEAAFIGGGRAEMVKGKIHSHMYKPSSVCSQNCTIHEILIRAFGVRVCACVCVY